MTQTLKFDTRKDDVLSLTDEIQRVVTESGVQEGICIIHSPHTTAGVTITSKWDETDFSDIKFEMRRIVPTRSYFSKVDLTLACATSANIIAGIMTRIVQSPQNKLKNI